MKLVVTFVALAGVLSAQALTPEQKNSVPEWAGKVLAQPAFARTYALDASINPFCLRGDFDGDGQADFAGVVRQIASKKIGFVVIHRATGRYFVLGAGTEIGNGGDDLAMIDAWRVFDKGAVTRGPEGAPPVLKGDALFVIKSESFSALLWWNGTAYRWYQQGD